MGGGVLRSEIHFISGRYARFVVVHFVGFYFRFNWRYQPSHVLGILGAVR